MMRLFIRGMRVRLYVRSARRCITAFVGPNVIIVVHDAHVCKNVASWKVRQCRMARTVIRTIPQRTLKRKALQACIVKYFSCNDLHCVPVIFLSGSRGISDCYFYTLIIAYRRLYGVYLIVNLYIVSCNFVTRGLIRLYK